MSTTKGQELSYTQRRTQIEFGKRKIKTQALVAYIFGIHKKSISYEAFSGVQKRFTWKFFTPEKEENLLP
jgi:hypothetical protein